MAGRADGGCPVGAGYECQSKEDIRDTKRMVENIYKILNGNGTTGLVTRVALCEERQASGKDSGRWWTTTVIAVAAALAAAVAVWK